VKDLDWGQWLLSQTPAEEFDETKFTTACSNSLIALFVHIKKQHWSKDLKLRYFDSFAAQDLTNDPSSMANVGPYFAHQSCA